LLTALSEGVAIYCNIGQDLAFWYAGGVAGTQWVQLKWTAPWAFAALIGALLLSRSITLLSLGDDVATGLGQRTAWVKLAAVIVVIVLAGSAVSVAGAVGFVGLVVPHIARYGGGMDYRWIIPCSAVLGSLFIVYADIGARMIHPPYETPIGALIAMIGVPFFLALVRKQGRAI
jgi:iron complex transport system permease protein